MLKFSPSGGQTDINKRMDIRPTPIRLHSSKTERQIPSESADVDVLSSISSFPSSSRGAFIQCRLRWRDELKGFPVLRDDLATQLFSSVGRQPERCGRVVPITLPNQIALQLRCAIFAEQQVIQPAKEIAPLALSLKAAPRLMDTFIEFGHVFP